MKQDRDVVEVGRLLDRIDKAEADVEHWRWAAAEKIAGLIAGGMTIKAIAAAVHRSPGVIGRYRSAWDLYGSAAPAARPAFTTVADGHHAAREQVSPNNRPAAVARWVEDDTVATDPAVVDALAANPAFLARLGRTMRDAEGKAQAETTRVMRDRHPGLSELAGWAAVGLLVDRATRATVQALEHVNAGDLGRADRRDTLRRAERLRVAVDWLVTAIESPNTDLDDALASLTDTP